MKKDLLFKFLDLEEGDAKKHWYSDFLSVSAIKFRIGWLFKRKPIKRWWDQEIVSNKHLTTCWPMTENWRKKWDKIFQQNMGKSAFEGMMKQFEIRQNQIRFATLVNKATEELKEIVFRNV